MLGSSLAAGAFENAYLQGPSRKCWSQGSCEHPGLKGWKPEATMPAWLVIPREPVCSDIYANRSLPALLPQHLAARALLGCRLGSSPAPGRPPRARPGGAQPRPPAWTPIPAAAAKETSAWGWKPRLPGARVVCRCA
eukprot:scaffold84016_cov25-Prasinocladus_malaysianus.AAC.1